MAALMLLVFGRMGGAHGRRRGRIPDDVRRLVTTSIRTQPASTRRRLDKLAAAGVVSPEGGATAANRLVPAIVAYVYAMRLAAFLLVVLAVAEKNRPPR